MFRMPDAKFYLYTFDKPVHADMSGCSLLLSDQLIELSSFSCFMVLSYSSSARTGREVQDLVVD